MISKIQTNPQLIEDAKKVIGDLLPAEIIDSEAYADFQRLNSNPILSAERRHVVFSSGRRVSLGTVMHHFKRFIDEDELPEEEAKSLLAKHKLYSSIMCRRNAALRKAYGTMVNGEGKYQRKADKFMHVKQELVELFGRMFTAKEVHELVVRQFQIPCTLQAVMNFRERFIDEINIKIEEHKRTYSDIRLGHKRSRLEELTWLYLTRKRTYEATKKADDHRLLLQTLEQIRKEVEGDTLRIDGSFTANVELTIQEHIQKELFTNFPLKEIILARVAARAKMDMGQLLLEINKSYYSVLLHPQDGSNPEMPVYPSTLTYDFDHIRRMHAQADRNKTIAAQAVTVTNAAPTSEADTIKAALLAKLRNKSEHINYQKEKLSGKFIDKANKD